MALRFCPPFPIPRKRWKWESAHAGATARANSSFYATFARATSPNIQHGLESGKCLLRYCALSKMLLPIRTLTSTNSFFVPGGISTVQGRIHFGEKRKILYDKKGSSRFSSSTAHRGCQPTDGHTDRPIGSRLDLSHLHTVDQIRGTLWVAVTLFTLVCFVAIGVLLGSPNRF